MWTQIALARTNFLRTTLGKNGAVLGCISPSARWWVIFGNYSGHERSIIKETKKVWNLPGLLNS